MPKFESRYFKYKIYKKLKSDIGGEVLLKYKRDKLTSFILRHFEYKLNQFKTNFKKWISIFHPQEKDYFEMRQPFLNVMNRKNEYKPFREGLTFKKKNDGLIVLFKHAHSVRRKLMKI